MGYTLYPPETGADAAVRLTLGLAPLFLLSAVAWRMRHGWLTTSLPWLLLLVGFAVYGPAMFAFSSKVAGSAPTWSLLSHLVSVIARVCVVVTLAALAVVGVKLSNQSEPA